MQRPACWIAAVVATAVGGLVIGGAAGGEASAAEPAADLATRGVEVGGGTWVPLPDPVVRLEAAQSAADLAGLAAPAGWERFAADAATAPVTVAIEPASVDGVRLGHRVRAAFTLRAPLEKLRADEALRRSLGSGEDGKGSTARPLAPEELREAGITAAAGEQFVWVELLLLNRVMVRGVVRATSAEHPDGVEVAWQFDPRFRDHATWRATWSRIEENDLGSRVEGPRQAYHGSGGIVAVRRLSAEAGVDLLVVESRAVIGEPEAWFQGSNLLRSKMPLAAQEGVRTLRRRLAAARE